jgi:hypothetical protein
MHTSHPGALCGVFAEEIQKVSESKRKEDGGLRASKGPEVGLPIGAGGGALLGALAGLGYHHHTFSQAMQAHQAEMGRLPPAIRAETESLVIPRYWSGPTLRRSLAGAALGAGVGGLGGLAADELLRRLRKK